eukprot:scaffold17645_cov90-Isochrysis_galbana.AAC.1
MRKGLEREGRGEKGATDLLSVGGAEAGSPDGGRIDVPTGGAGSGGEGLGEAGAKGRGDERNAGEAMAGHHTEDRAWGGPFSQPPLRAFASQQDRSTRSLANLSQDAFYYFDIYNAGAEDPVITHDDALDVVRSKIFSPRDAYMDRHQSIMAALELGQHPDLIGHLVLLELGAYLGCSTA